MGRHESLPLTTAQRGLWVSQQVVPNAIMAIAEAVEIRGAIDVDLFRKALHQLVTEVEDVRVRIIEQDGQPRQVVRPVYEGDFPFVDMTREADPPAAIHAWMMNDVARPIDLANDPLWAAALLKASDDRYFWYHRAHHIAMDGFGGGLVARRLAELYTAYAQDSEPPASTFCPLETTIEAEATYRGSQRFQRDREFWLHQLAGLPDAVTLSQSHRRYGPSTTLRRSVGYLSADTVRRLTELGKSAAASLPQVLIGLVASYYQRATCVDELVFGMPVSGRLSTALRNSVAVSANVVPIRIAFTSEMTAADLFAQVSRTVRSALRHQQYRYEDLRRDLGLVGHGKNIAWLGINIEPFDYRLNFAGAETVLHNVSNTSAEDLMVFVYDRGTDVGLRFDIDANPSLYSTGELDEHRRRLTRLIEQVLAEPDTPLRQLDILGDQERQRLLVDWNDTTTSLPCASLPSLVAHWAQATPDAPAVVFEGTTVSYSELHDRSVRQARLLRASGAKPGELIGVALPRSEQLLVVLLAIMRTGAAYLPLDPDGPVERLALVLDDASPAIVVAQADRHAQLFRDGVTLLQPEHLKALSAHTGEVPDVSTPEGTAYVLYTSGSTGRPKGVEVTHRNLNNFLQAMQRELTLRASDCFLAETTVLFDMAALELFLPLTVGARAAMTSSEAVHDPPHLARAIRSSGATYVQATPSLWRALLAYADLTLDGIHVVIGGEALSGELAARLMRKATRVTQGYGPTETTVYSTVFELDERSVAAPPIGRPILNTQVYVLDSDRHLLQTGAVGELYIGGAGVAKGYFRQPALTEERFLPNPFANDGSRMYRTGDLVRWTDRGLLEFIGRADDQVKINGHRVEPGEIESVLLEHPTIADASVVAHRHDDRMVSLAAYLVARSGTVIDVRTLRVFLASRVPSYMMPASFTVLEAMPLTPNGKLDRHALPPPESVSRTIYVAPVTATEKKLATLWQQILGVERVGVHDDFFELGGDSVKAAELVAQFPRHFEAHLPLGSLFEASTIADLSTLVERLGSHAVDPLRVVLPLRRGGPQHGGCPRPLFCIHPIAGISLGFSSLLPHLDPAMPVYALQARGLQNGTPLPGSIKAMAADYLSEIRSIQPEGPYRLIGRSMGGLVGHSIAEQMLAQDLDVELLAMIDCLLFTSEAVGRPHSEADKIRMALSFLGIHLDDDRTPRSLEELGVFLVHTYHARAVPMVDELTKSNARFIEHLFAVMLNNLELARRYVPAHVDVDVVYFQAADSAVDLEGIVGNGASAWRPFIGRTIDVHTLACHHEAVLDPAPAAQIGRVLRQRLSTRDERSAMADEEQSGVPSLAIPGSRNGHDSLSRVS